jgi:hypothetical protein
VHVVVASAALRWQHARDARLTASEQHVGEGAKGEDDRLQERLQPWLSPSQFAVGKGMQT